MTKTKHKLRIISDLHLDYNKCKIDIPVLDNEKEQILIIAGDVAHFEDWHYQSTKNWIKDKTDRFKSVVLVLGNHDYYEGWFDDVDVSLRLLYKDTPNLHFLDNETMTIDGLVITGATMWTDLNTMTTNNTLYDFYAERGMQDYRYIRGIKPELTRNKFQEFQTKTRPGHADVIVTHHAPSPLSVSKEYQGHILNGCFTASKCIVADKHPKLWIHGHVHQSHNYTVGDTLVIANPHGYGAENPSFDPNLIIEIETNNH